MRFPKRIEFRGENRAVIYNKKPGYDYYRACYSAGGKRFMKSFSTYSEALAWAEEKAREVASGSGVATLTPGQAADCMSALDKLESLRLSTGRRLTLLGAVGEFVEAVSLLPHGRTIREAVQGFMANTASVKREDLDEAVKRFLAGRKHLAESKDGKRSAHNPTYEYNVANWLNEFAGTFPGHAVCDLTKEHLNKWIAKHSDVGTKSRNDKRAAVTMFLSWAVREDLLARDNRLGEATGMQREQVDLGDIDFYRPDELKTVLDTTWKEQEYRELLPVIALGALGGIRVEECLRLDWADVWKIPGKVEIGTKIAKGRRRRLVSMGESLRQWLQPFRDATGPVWAKSSDAYHEGFERLRSAKGIPTRKNGLRHGAASHHMAAYQNENLTAAELGNSPAMLHQHYRGLTTEAEGKKWFAVAPPTPAENVIPMPAAGASITS